MKIGFFVSRKQGTATVELGVFDAQSGAYTTRSFYRATKNSSAWAPGLSSARNKRTGAIAAAIGKGIKEFVTRLGTRPLANGKGWWMDERATRPFHTIVRFIAMRSEVGP